MLGYPWCRGEARARVGQQYGNEFSFECGAAGDL